MKVRGAFLSMTSVRCDLVCRLENWASWVRVRTPQGISATGRFCESLARSKGQIEAAREPHPDVDVNDAVFVEKALAPPGMPKAEKAALVAWYLMSAPPWVAKSYIKRRGGAVVHYAQYEHFVVRAHQMADNRIAYMERKRMMRANSTLTAVSASLHPKGFARSEKTEAA